MRDGDTLVVWKLDRIGRSLPHVVGLVDDLQKLKAAMALMADRDTAARDVAVQLGVSVSTLYAYVDAKGRPRERVDELLAKRRVSATATA